MGGRLAGTTIAGADAANLLSGAQSGTYRVINPLDHIPRIVSFRRLADYPMIVAVGLDEAEALQVWQRQRLQTLAGGLLLTAVAALLGGLLMPQHRRVWHSRRALAGTLGNISQGIMMIDPDGRVPFVNQRAIELLDLPPCSWPSARAFATSSAGSSVKANSARSRP
jgi:PAS domain-containing protein